MKLTNTCLVKWMLVLVAIRLRFDFKKIEIFQIISIYVLALNIGTTHASEHDYLNERDAYCSFSVRYSEIAYYERQNGVSFSDALAAIIYSLQASKFYMSSDRFEREVIDSMISHAYKEVWSSKNEGLQETLRFVRERCEASFNESITIAKKKIEQCNSASNKIEMAAQNIEDRALILSAFGANNDDINNKASKINPKAIASMAYKKCISGK